MLSKFGCFYCRIIIISCFLFGWCFALVLDNLNKILYLNADHDITGRCAAQIEFKGHISINLKANPATINQRE